MLVFQLLTEKFVIPVSPDETLATALGRLFETTDIPIHQCTHIVPTLDDHCIELYHKIKEIPINESSIIVLKTRKSRSKKALISQDEITKNPFNLQLKQFNFGLYFGQLADGLMNGKGTLFFNNGGIYTGEWKNNKSNGKGYEFFNNGDYYIGDYVNDIKSGRGIYKYANGSFYDGEYKNDMMCGKGLEKYNDGTIYEGQYFNGKKNGVGLYKWGNGDIYEGEWRDNKKHGRGIYRYANGNVVRGLWSDGQQTLTIYS